MGANVPRKKMLLKSKTLAEIGIIEISYPIKVRIKEFEIRHRDGSIVNRGPCVSLQQFNPEGRFLSAISFDLTEFADVVYALEKYIPEIRRML